MNTPGTNNGNGSPANPAGTSPPRMTAEEALSSIGPRPAVARLSPRAVLAVGGAVAGLGLIVLVLGFGSHASPPTRETAAEENAVRPTGPVEAVRELPADYAFTAVPAAATQPADTTPDGRAAADARHQLVELRQRLAEQQRKEQEQALDSPLVFAGARAPGRSPAAMGSDTGVAANGSASPPEPSRSLPPGYGLPVPPAATPAGERLAALAAAGGQPPEKAAFLTAAAAVEPYVRKPLLDPISPYELKAGTVIPGALVTGINTDLPGDVVGQVTENVYDSATGRYLLVPQGARLLGRYQALVGNGQNRALLAWQRLVYPDGRSVELEAMPGTDAAGAAGLADRVDYHLDKLAAATALSTAIAYGGNLARNRQSGYGGYSNQDVIGDTVAQEADRVGSKVIDRQLDVQPTITVRPGWPFRVLVNKDLVLASYDADDGRDAGARLTP